MKAAKGINLDTKKEISDQGVLSSGDEGGKDEEVLQWDESDSSDNSIGIGMNDAELKQDISFAGSNKDGGNFLPESDTSMADIDDDVGPSKNNLRVSKDFKIPDQYTGDLLKLQNSMRASLRASYRQ